MSVVEFLDRNRVPYRVMDHRMVFDAQRMAASLHVPGKAVAKTVLLRRDGDPAYIVAVLPATRRVNLRKAERALQAAEVYLATELEMHQQCPDCERGVLPPFGSRYGMATLVDRSLAENEQIVFEGDTHRQTVGIRYADFLKLESPAVASFAD